MSDNVAGFGPAICRGPNVLKENFDEVKGKVLLKLFWFSISVEILVSHVNYSLIFHKLLKIFFSQIFVI